MRSMLNIEEGSGANCCPTGGTAGEGVGEADTLGGRAPVVVDCSDIGVRARFFRFLLLPLEVLEDWGELDSASCEEEEDLFLEPVSDWEDRVQEVCLANTFSSYNVHCQSTQSLQTSQVES